MIDTNNITIALTDARIRNAIVPDSKAEIYFARRASMVRRSCCSSI